VPPVAPDPTDTVTAGPGYQTPLTFWQVMKMPVFVMALPPEVAVSAEATPVAPASTVVATAVGTSATGVLLEFVVLVVPTM
jgi:hypothetical protein